MRAPTPAAGIKAKWRGGFILGESEISAEPDLVAINLLYFNDISPMACCRIVYAPPDHLQILYVEYNIFAI
jgi:hypothetical protein